MVKEFRSFGRRRGRKLRPYQHEIYHRVLPQLEIALPEEGLLDLSGLFSDTDRLINLEIGFGGGEYLYQRSQLFPEQNFIGAEPYENGVAKLLTMIDETWPDPQTQKSNLRLYVDDVRDLLDKIPTNSLSRIDIPFPDPWPKLRHHRRRLINAELLHHIKRVLKHDGLLSIATDHEDYLRAILQLMQSEQTFSWLAKSSEDWQKPWYGIYTRYAEKAAEAGRSGHYLNYRYSRAVSLA